MKLRLLAIMAVLALALPAFAQTDQLDLRAAAIVNAPNVREWPITTAITHISLTGSNTRFTFTKQDGENRWPDLAWGAPGDSLQYTVWLFVKVGGQWTGSGFIQMWHGRDGVGDAPSDYSTNWYYGTRWSPIQQHGPIVPGETIGFMVTTGNARDNGGPLGAQERSNIVTIPATDTGEFSFGAVTPAPPVVVPVPPPPVVVPPAPPAPVVIVPAPQPAPLPTDLTSAIISQSVELARIEAKVDKVTQDVADFRAAVKSKWDAFWGSPYVKYALAAATGLLAKYGVTGSF
jgi:hypothetical protein